MSAPKAFRCASSGWYAPRDDCTGLGTCWLELGTEYHDNVAKNFGYLCLPDIVCGYLYHIAVYNDVGSHTWKIDRNTGNHNIFNEYIDGNLAYTLTGVPYTNGVLVSAGLESYKMNIAVETTAFFNLKYKKGDGSYQNWAGEDDNTDPIEDPMCGQWHGATSWWAGEETSCS